MIATFATNVRHYHEKSSLLPSTRSDEETNRRARGESGNSKVTIFFAISLLLVGVFMAKFCDNKHQVYESATSSILTGMNKSILPSDSALTSWSSSSNAERKDTKLSEFYNDTTIQGKTDMPLRWGILGLGRIARDFATALKMSGANITAVAAGSLPDAKARARTFADLYSVPQFYGSYEELALDGNVDIVYIATINILHYDTTTMMLRAGKNVLVEKPMAMDQNEAKAMADEAKKANRLLITNYWTRFFPIIKYIRLVLARREIGSIYAMRGDFGFPAQPNATDRFLSRLNGGGALLDLGCYLVNLAVMLNPNSPIPAKIESSAQKTYLGVDYGVDTEASFILQWDSPAKKRVELDAKQIEGTSLNSTMIMTGQVSFRRPSTFEVEISGGQGRLVIQGPANSPTEFTIYEYEPYGPLKKIENVRSELPIFDESYGPAQYPHASGFTYIINDIERCMLEKGIPGGGVEVDHHKNPAGCFELEPLTMEDQLNTVRITDDIMQQVGYWSW